jgi:hypothetical protein
MTPFCARCGETNPDDAVLCALCAARVALDNAEVDFVLVLNFGGTSHTATDGVYRRLDEARKAYHALCVAGRASEVGA